MCLSRLTKEEVGNLNTIRHALEECSNGNPEEFIRAFSENGTYRITAPMDSQLGPVFHGHDGVRELLMIVGDAVSIEEFKIDSCVACGERVVLTGTETIVMPDDRRASSHWAQLFILSEGKIVEAVAYQDLSPLLAVLES